MEDPNNLEDEDLDTYKGDDFAADQRVDIVGTRFNGCKCLQRLLRFTR